MSQLYDAGRIDSYLERVTEAHQLTGAACLIRHRGELVYERYVGSRDYEGLEPLDETAIYRLFSMTKVITCTAALQLYEAGRFRLSDPVGDYMPAWRNMERLEIGPTGEILRVPCRRPVRIVDLFTMSAGLSYGGSEHPIDVEMKKAEAELGERCGDYSTREFADALAGLPLYFEPGTHWRYSLCHDVLGALIEEISGQLFSDYLEEHIFRPLGMVDTAFWVPVEKRARCVALSPAATWRKYEAGSDLSREVATMAGFERRRFESGGGGLKGTLGDYMAFADCLTHLGTSVDGVRLLSRGTVELMRRDHLDDARRADYSWDVQRGYSYGLGVRTLVDPAAAGSNGQPGEFGWAGAAGTWFMMDPAEELTLVFGQRRMPNLEDQVAPIVRTLAYACLPD
ncbi:MAG: serine hydrolase domain-containing protein [Bacillota bacterium]|nr:serine hydrolase domain-containing protein [Bacillota bacterium]